MGAYRDSQMLEAMNADANGYRDGIRDGQLEERHRLAKTLGIDVGVLAVLGAGDGDIVQALNHVQEAVVARIRQLQNPTNLDTGVENG